MATLTSLPYEITASILTLLDCHSLANLRSTSPVFSTFISESHLTLAFLITKLRLLYSEKDDKAHWTKALPTISPLAQSYIQPQSEQQQGHPTKAKKKHQTNSTPNHTTTSTITLSTKYTTTTITLNSNNHSIPAFQPSLAPHLASSQMTHLTVALHLLARQSSYGNIDTSTHPCYFCLLRLPTDDNFVPKQLRGKRKYAHEDCVRRFCNDCAVRRGKWRVGSVVSVGRRRKGGEGEGEEYLLVCSRCGRVKPLRTKREEEKERREDEQKEKQEEEEGQRWRFSNVCEECQIEAMEERERGEREGREGEGQGEANGEAAQQQQQRSMAGKTAWMSKRIRANRCQRCWSISHKQSPAEHEEGGQLMCSMCYNIATRAR